MKKFWLEKTLEEMTNEEWESLCDGCGKCCLEKVEDEDNGKIYASCVSCRLLDGETCKCACYDQRFNYMDDCIKLTVKNVYEISWLPKNCAYSLVREGKDLPKWHPLITGDKESTIKSGNSVKEFVIHPVQMLPKSTILDYLIDEEDI